MKVNDAILGLLLVALAAVVALAIRAYPSIPGQTIGPAAFPGLLAALLAVCGVGLVIQGWQARAGQPWWQPAAWWRSPRHRLAFAITLAAMLGAYLGLETIGFLPCAVAILLAMFVVLRVRLAVALPVALAVALGIHTVFYFGLRVPLPWGVLQPIAW